jgi:hypothetical protein
MDLLLNLGRLEMAHPDPAIFREGESKLMTLLVGSNQVAGSAALALLSPAYTNRINFRLVSRLVSGHPVTTVEMDLARLVVQIRAEPSRTKEFLAHFLGATQKFWEQPRFRRLAQCLLEQGAFTALLGLVSEDTAIHSEELCSIRLEALWRVGEWTAVANLLDRPESKATKSLETIYRAMLAGAEKRTNEIGRLWDAAITANQRNPALLEVVANRAERALSLKEATRAWREIMVFPDLTERATKEVLRLCNQTGDLEPAYAAYRRLRQLFPANVDLRLNVALHQLLLRLDEPEAMKTLDQLSPEERKLDLAKVTHALAALRTANPDQALQLINSVEGDWESAPRLWRTIRIAAVGQTGQKALARQLVAKSKAAEVLSAAEFELVKGWLP